MMFTNFYGLGAHLQKSKTPQAHHILFLINYIRLVKEKGLDLGPSPPSQVKFFEKKYCPGLYLLIGLIN